MTLTRMIDIEKMPNVINNKVLKSESCETLGFILFKSGSI